MERTTQIKQLRNQLPIGLKAAEKYLITTNGSVEEAAALFHADMKKLFISKMDSTEEEAERFLLANQYDLGKAMDKYEREKFNHVEYVVRHTKEKKNTLYSIMPHIGYTLETNKSLTDYPESYHVYKSFDTIMEWLSYYGWEGYLKWNKEVLFLLKKEFKLPLLAQQLENLWSQMKKRAEELEEQQKSLSEIVTDPVRQKLDNQEWKVFESHEEELINNIYDYIIKNLHLFTF